MAKRIQLADNYATKVFTAKSIILANNYNELIKLTSQKFRFKPNNIRLFIGKTTFNGSIGVEIKSDDDFKKYVVDDILLVVSGNKEDFKGKLGKKNVSQDVLKKISYPPCYPYPSKGIVNRSESNISDVTDIVLTDVIVKRSDIKINDIKFDREMKGIFPILKGNVLNMIRKVIESEPKISEFDFDDYICFDYNDGAMFDVSNANNLNNMYELSVKKECRGLIVSKHTGHILARRLHKFFNLNENNQTHSSDIDFNDVLSVSEKIDGTLVSPILLDNNQMIWASRKNRIYEVEKFISTHYIKYNVFSLNYLIKQITPIFEWCDNLRIPGMIHYMNKQLTLIALRDNINGNYYPISDIIDVPITIHHNINDINNMNEFIVSVQNSTNREGVVINMKSGEKYKLKSYWFVQMYQAIKSGGINNFLPEYLKLRNTIIDVPEDKIWFTAIQNNDDVVALCVTILDNSDNESNEFVKFVKTVQTNMKILEQRLVDWVTSNYVNVPDVDILNSVAELAGWSDWLVSDIIKKNPISDKLKSFLINFTKTRNINVLEELLDVKWNAKLGKSETVDDILDLVTFHKCDKNIKDHVLKSYLPKKISNILGINSKQIYNDTLINIPDNYSPDEGKILGFWEQFTKDDIWDLRIDLQPQRKEYNEHYGNSEYALLLVQYGLINNPDTKPHGSLAGILIPTKCDLCYEYLVKSIELSFDTQKIVKMKRRNNLNDKNNFKIFCDLDGVLTDFEKGVINLTGRTTSDQTVAKMWQRISNHPNFFESLEWTQNGKELWNKICEISNSQPIILTGIPTMLKKQYNLEKKRWCEKNLGKDISVITCNSSEKYKYATTNHVLIDDRIENGKLWVTYGGIFIHHQTPERTLYELNKLYNKDKIHLEIIPTSEQIIYSNSTKISIITDIFPDIKDNIIAIDSEWDPNAMTDTLSIFQIATVNNVYIIDMIEANDIVKEQLKMLLINKNIIKICFGIETGELIRIRSDIINLIDIQEIIIDQFNIQMAKIPSLSLVTSCILGKNLLKTKEYQVSSWGMRPLSEGQINYAANDVTVLLDIYKKLNDSYKCNVCTKNIFCPKNYVNVKAKNDFDPNIPVKLLYSGIFLSDQSKKELLKNFPAIHKNVYADHVTLQYEPTEYNIRGTPIGDIVPIKIIGYYTDDLIQVVQCMYNNELYHITISCAHTINPSISNSIDEESWTQIKEIQLFGTVGVMIENVIDSLSSLSQKIRTKINEFIDAGLVGSSLKFKPNELSAAERSVVHEYASNNGIFSESNGKDDKRYLTLTIKRKLDKNMINIDNDRGDMRKITDSFQFSSLNIINANSATDVQNINFAGIITNNGINFNDFELTNNDNNQLIILRGLSGSGKSSVSKSFDNPLICSADDYFDQYLNGEFNKDKLNDAHDYCYNLAKEGVMNGAETVIIDNTNSRLSEYKKYVELAKEHNYDTKIYEIFCENKEQAIKFANRSIHKVPIKDVLKMLSRWETDDDALILKPYMNADNMNTYNEIGYESLNKWLTNMKFFHYNKLRRKTHLIPETESRQATFIDIPNKYYDEFLEKYVSNPDEPKYLIELINSEVDSKFKMFFDIDHVSDNELSHDEILNIICILQTLIKGIIYVTGCTSLDNNRIKTGIHLKCPNTIVTSKEALDIRSKFVDKLCEKIPDKNWKLIIDDGVYTGCRGIRMLGSRKVTKKMDKGRVYKLLFAVDSDGNKFIPELTDVEIMKQVSINNMINCDNNSSSKTL